MLVTLADLRVKTLGDIHSRATLFRSPFIEPLHLYHVLETTLSRLNISIKLFLTKGEV